MARKEFGKRVKAAAFKRCNGYCEGCGKKLEPGQFQFDHIVPDGLGGEPTLENCKVLCSGGRASCHGIKTHEVDRPAMQKADNVRNRHNNLTAPRRKIPQPPRAPKRPSKAPLPARPMFKDAS